MLKMVDGTGIIGVDMVCPLGVSAPQPPNYDRVELEGAGMLVLPNSLDAPLERLELGGKTEQVQTTGAQLFDANQYEGATKNGVTVTVKDGVITATGTANINAWIQIFVSKENYQKLFKPENKIYLKANKSKDCNYDFGLYGSFGSPIVGTIREGNSGKELPAELPRNDTDFYFFIDVKNGVELKGSIKPIVYHDGDGTWEPYTGGKPSPSPEYPQEIKNSGKWNEEKQKYEIVMQVKGADTELQSLTLTSDRPLTKWDRLVEQGGEIGWLYAGVVIDRFDGQSNKISIANKQGDVQNFSIRFENVANGNGNSDIFVDKYRAVQISYTKVEYGICCNWNDGVKYFSAPNENVATVDEFKEWLVENPLKIAYETTKTEFVPLPQSEQNAIRALKTYYPTTVITADGGELDPDIKVTYRKEI